MKPSELRPEHVGRTVTVTLTRTGELTLLDSPTGFLRVGEVLVSMSPAHAEINVELARPAVPTGLGAVVRLDGPDGPLALHDRPGTSCAWHVFTDSSRYEDPGTDIIAARIFDVITEGIHP